MLKMQRRGERTGAEMVQSSPPSPSARVPRQRRGLERTSTILRRRTSSTTSWPHGVLERCKTLRALVLCPGNCETAECPILNPILDLLSHVYRRLTWRTLQSVLILTQFGLEVLFIQSQLEASLIDGKLRHFLWRYQKGRGLHQVGSSTKVVSRVV